MILRVLLLALAAAVVSGCAYKAAPLDAPSYNVVTSFSEKIHGKWLLAVNAEALDQNVKPSTYACSFHNFPLQLSSVYVSSVAETLRNVFDQIEPIPTPIPGDQARKRGAKGIIVIRGEEVRPRLDIQPGFWSANMKTQVVVVASVYVDGPTGRVFGTAVEAQGIADAEAGMMCEGGAKSLVDASATAIRDSVRKIAEALGNSERVRYLK
jgi:hypothetical protein